jgi:DNA polymerase III alpha subunit
MKTDYFGEVVLNENDLIQGLYSGKITNPGSVNIEDQHLIDQFNNACIANADPMQKIVRYSSPDISVSEYDQTCQKSWLIPDEYKNFDVESYIRSLCVTDEEAERVDMELRLFHQYDMINVLKFLKYLVDTMRSNNVVWGVGRGSSVASYCLFLIGAHRINSLKYNLDITEFLK